MESLGRNIGWCFILQDSIADVKTMGIEMNFLGYLLPSCYCDGPYVVESLHILCAMIVCTDAYLRIRFTSVVDSNSLHSWWR